MVPRTQVNRNKDSANPVRRRRHRSMSRPSRAAAPDALSIGADSRVAVAEASAAPPTWTQPASAPSSGALLKISPSSDSGPAELARGPPAASPGGAAPTTPRPAASWAQAAAVALVLSTTFFLSHLFGEWAWLGSSKEARVWCYGWLTAASTGLGAIPFWFVREMRPSWIAICNALAGGMMIAASLGMIKEGIAEPDPASLEPILPHWASVLVGFALGIVFVKMTQGFLEKHEDLRFGSMAGLDARRVLLIVAVMTLHSLTEGVGIGVAFGGANGNALGSFISAMLAIHNVPEGLAVRFPANREERREEGKTGEE